MMLVSMISYIDRSTLAILAPTILKETHLSNEQYGLIISAFSVLYMVGNPVWGRILDRIGVRRGMATAVGLWTLASASHALVGGMRGFALARAALGFGEGATFPGGLRTVVQTLPPHERSRGTAIAYSGGSFGAVLTPLIITPIAAAWGWRGAFWFTGLIGAAWLIWWGLLGRSGNLTRQPETIAATGLSMSWKDRDVWAFLSAYALGAIPLGFVLYQSSLYLSAYHHLSQGQIGKVLWVPPLGWEAGYFFWGWVIDRFAKGGASMIAMRRILVTAAVMSFPIAAIPFVSSLLATLALFFLSMFVVGAFILGSIAYATNTYSTRYAGLISGMGAGSWSALVALLMPWFGHLFDLRNYHAAFALISLLPAIGTCGWLLLDRPKH